MSIKRCGATGSDVDPRRTGGGPAEGPNSKPHHVGQCSKVIFINCMLLFCVVVRWQPHDGAENGTALLVKVNYNMSA